MNEKTPEFISQWINLAQPRLGAEVVECSDDFFAECSRMLKPEAPVFIDGKFDDHGKWMDGWESRRRREPGHDWCLIELGHPGTVEQIVIDTAHFKGNYPDRCSIQGALIEPDSAASIVSQSETWAELLPAQKLEMDQVHRFDAEIQAIGPISHIRVNIFPDGGLSRVRILGRIHGR